MAARPHRQGDQIEVVAGPWGEDGHVHCALESGWTLRFLGAVPGELVRVRVEHVSQGGPVLWGSLEELVHPGPSRRKPPCNEAASCGACPTMYSGNDQFALKVDSRLHQLPEQLRAVLLPESAWVRSPTALDYRCKAVFLPLIKNNRLELGAFQRGTHNVLPLPNCLVLHPALRELRDSFRAVLEPLVVAEGLKLRTLILRCSRDGATLATLILRARPSDRQLLQLHSVASDLVDRSDTKLVGVHWQLHDAEGDAVAGRGKVLQLTGVEQITETILGRPFTVRPLAFFQLNPGVLEGILREMVTQSLSLGIQRTSSPTGELLDLYCGGGVLGLSLGAELGYEQILGVDISAPAIDDARENCRRHGREGPVFMLGKTGELIDPARLHAASIALVDPPRSGLRPAALRLLCTSGPKQLFYVACSTAALARDAAALMDGGYEPSFLFPADMLPQTAYVEWVAGFHRQGAT